MLLSVFSFTILDRVDPRELVLALKERLEAELGIPLNQQRLVYQGKAMADYQTFEHYKVRDGDVVHMVTALVGGTRT